MGKRIYDTRDLSEYSKSQLKQFDKAVLAAAFKVRDEARQAFIDSKPQYKMATSKYTNLVEGIMVGRLNDNHSVKVHALGSRSKKESYKTRFFVGGTIQRFNGGYCSYNGQIDENEAIDKGLKDGQKILDTYINNTLK